MWCPKCRNEYRKGITVCADCGCPLVDSLEEYDREQTKKAAEAENESLSSEQEAQASDYEAPAVDEELCETEGRETGDNTGEPVIGIRGADKTPGHKHTYAYQDSDSKAAENKSSADALLGVGIAGLIFITLLFFGKIPFFTITGSNRYFICGVMGVMFILFIVMGIVSMKSFKKLKAEAQSEHSIEEEIRKWCGDNLTADLVDSMLSEEDQVFAADSAGSETAYFVRTVVIRDRINSQFVGLDEAFLDHFVDEYYSTLYGEAKETADAADEENDEDID